MISLTRSSGSNRKIIVDFLLLFIISRIYLLFIPVILQDASYLTIEKEYWTNPKISVPILYLLQILLFHRLFGFNVVGIRIGMVIFDTLCLFLLYKLSLVFQVKELKKTPEKARENSFIIVLIFAFLPSTLFNYTGAPETLTMFFLLVGLYYYIIDKYSLAAFFLSLGFQTEFYPIFCLIPILIQLFSKKDFKNILKMVFFFAGTFVLIEFLYFLIDPVNFLNNYLVQFSRSPTSISIWEYVYNNSAIWNIISLGDFIKISWVGLTFLLFFIPYVIIIFIYFQRHKKSSKRQVIAFISMFLLLFPIIFLSIFTRYLYFVSPLICLETNSRDNFQTNFKRAIIITIMLIPVSVISLVLWPNLLFTEIIEAPNTIDNIMIYYLLYLSFIFLNSLFWIKSGKRYYFMENRNENPTTLQLFPFSIIMMTLQIMLQGLGLACLVIFYLVGLISIVGTLQRIRKSSVLQVPQILLIENSKI